MPPFWAEVDDDTLKEVGRLTLAAVELEDLAYAVCRYVRSPRNHLRPPPIGDAIADARKAAAEEFSDVDARGALDEWLARAAEALTQRNEVLHAVPVTFVTVPGTTPVPETTGPYLTYMPRDDKRPPVHRKVSVAELQPVRRALTAAAEGLDDLINRLDASRVQREAPT